MMNITILFGTETGNAEVLAEDLQSELQDSHKVQICNMSDFKMNDFSKEQFYVIVCSTYGDGDLPTSAEPFYDEMVQQQPNLSDIQFTSFGLGDMEYEDTFNFGCRKIDTLFIQQGATRIGEMQMHDASSDSFPEDLAIDWIKNVLDQIEQ